MIAICLTESGRRHAFNRTRSIEFTVTTIHPRDSRPRSYQPRVAPICGLWGCGSSPLRDVVVSIDVAYLPIGGFPETSRLTSYTTHQSVAESSPAIPKKARRDNYFPMAMFDPADDEQRRYRAYGPALIPDPRDREVEEFMVSLIAGGPKRVAEVKSVIGLHGKRVLTTYAERMATGAVRTHDPTLLERALVALVLGGLDNNERESLMVMAPIEDSANRIGVDVEDLFQRTSRIVGPQGTVSLVSWLSRKPENRSLASMRFVPSHDSGGFRYKLEW